MKLSPTVVILVLTSLCLQLLCAEARAESQQMNSVMIGKLRQEMTAHEEKIDQSSQQELSLLNEMDRLDEKILKQKIKIEEFNVKLKEQERVIAAKEKEIAAIVQQNQAVQQHLLKRLKSFYLMGKTGLVNISFSSKSLPDLLLTHDGFQFLITYDHSIFRTYRENVAAIDRVKRSHELEKAVLENFLTDADKEKQILQQAAAEKNNLLKRVQAQRSLYEQALKEMKKAENNLAATPTAANKTQAARPRAFAVNKGKLPPPVWGEIISLFQQEPAPNEDSTFINGITIRVANKAEIFAVYDGDVIFAGEMRGYGKLLIIDHDQQYFSVTAKIDELRVKEGDQVKQGQLVGIMGKNSAKSAKSVYFEIRHDEVAEDPLEWIKPGTLANHR